MNRKDFFVNLEQRLQYDVKFPLEIKSNGHSLDETTTNTDDFEIWYSIQGRTFVLSDKKFDKYYYLKGFIKDVEKDSLKYKPNDMDIAVRNVKHLILDKFGEDFLYTRSTAKMKL